MNARGGLYTKYNNQIRYYRCKGLIEATPKRSKVSADNTSQHNDMDTDAYSDHEVTIELKRESDADDYNS